MWGSTYRCGWTSTSIKLVHCRVPYHTYLLKYVCWPLRTANSFTFIYLNLSFFTRIQSPVHPLILDRYLPTYLGRWQKGNLNIFCSKSHLLWRKNLEQNTSGTKNGFNQSVQAAADVSKFLSTRYC